MLNKMIIVVLLSLGVAMQSAGAEEVRPVQLALFNPVQLVPAEESIKGMRLSVLYSDNKDVTGLDFAWLGVNRTSGDMNGVGIGLGNWVVGSAYGGQIGLVNHAGRRCVGMQYGFANVVDGGFTGLQWGLVNWAEGFMHGIQGGVVNVSKGQSAGVELGIVNYNEGSFKGLQLGIVNYTKNLDGLQIGLANYNGNKKPMEFMVLANWSF